MEWSICLFLPALQTHGDAVFYYAHGEAGMSLHLPDDPTEMIVGAPGVYKWRGERTIHRIRETNICVLLLVSFATVFLVIYKKGLCVSSYFINFVCIYCLSYLFCVFFGLIL